MKRRAKRMRSLSSVVASKDPIIAKGEVISHFGCKACSAQFASNLNSPYCVECGSEEVEQIEGQDLDAENLEALPEESLSYAQCPSCGTCNVISDATVASLNGTANCTVCGTEMQFTVPEDADADADLGGDDIDFKDEASDLDEVEEVVSEDEAEEVEEAEGEDEETVDESGCDVEIDSADEDEVEMPMTDLSKVQEGEHKVRFIRAGNNTILSFVDDLCVAKLHASKAGDNEDIFQEAKFMKALTASYSTNGLEATLKDFNFDIAKVKVSRSKSLSAAIDKAEKEATAKVKSELADTKAVLNQCLCIAAAGLNKGHFKEHSHEIKAKMFEELNALGVRNASAVIDRVFASTSDAYNTTLISLAFDLMSRPEDVRNHIANAIGESNYATADVDEFETAEDDEDTVDEVEARLSSGVVESSLAKVVSMKQTRRRIF